MATPGCSPAKIGPRTVPICARPARRRAEQGLRPGSRSRAAIRGQRRSSAACGAGPAPAGAELHFPAVHSAGRTARSGYHAQALPPSPVPAERQRNFYYLQGHGADHEWLASGYANGSGRDSRDELPRWRPGHNSAYRRSRLMAPNRRDLTAQPPGIARRGIRPARAARPGASTSSAGAAGPAAVHGIHAVQAPRTAGHARPGRLPGQAPGRRPGPHDHALGLAPGLSDSVTE